MKQVINILIFLSTFLAFGISQAVSSNLDEVICNAMKGMQEQEEKKIPYNIGNYTLTSLTVDCEKKALITEQKLLHQR